MSKAMHLIIAPLPVSENWMIEFKKYAPHMNVILYKGNEREKLRHEISTRKNYY